MLSTFEVLSSAVRRDIIAQLRRGPSSVSDLNEALGISQPVVSKHLRVLRDTGFVRVRPEGQRRWYELRTEPFREVDEWLEPYRWMWEDRLDRLGRHLDAQREENQS